tara:strand:+ start:2422 stop:3309 length:888 start_codon:yes stop_codon:yes gene_type:complete
MKKIKIAVCLSGLIRYWDVTAKIHEYWNNLYDDVEFYFFVSAWDGEGVYFDSEKVVGGIIEKNDYSKYSFLTDYEYLYKNELREEILLYMEQTPDLDHCVPYYTYAIFRTQELRKKYEQENNMEFDGVIQTRNDVWIPTGVLDSVRNLFYGDMGTPVVPELFFSLQPLTVSNNRFFMQQDVFGFSHRLAMDKYAEMYDRIEIIKPTKNNPRYQVKNMSLHHTNADVLMDNKIYNYPLFGVVYVIRIEPYLKEGWPTPNQLKYVVENKGLEYLHNSQNVGEICKNYFTKKFVPYEE